jgi:hypothetical protein
MKSSSASCSTTPARKIQSRSLKDSNQYQAINIYDLLMQ